MNVCRITFFSVDYFTGSNLQLWENVDVTKIPNPSFPSEPNEAENYWVRKINIVFVAVLCIDFSKPL